MPNKTTDFIDPVFRLGPFYWGKSFPRQSHSVDARRDFYGGPTKHVGSGDKMLRGEQPWARN